jgi:hypothetical protein
MIRQKKNFEIFQIQNLVDLSDGLFRYCTVCHVKRTKFQIMVQRRTKPNFIKSSANEY